MKVNGRSRRQEGPSDHNAGLLPVNKGEGRDRVGRA